MRESLEIAHVFVMSRRWQIISCYVFVFLIKNLCCVGVSDYIFARACDILFLFDSEIKRT